MFGSPPQKSRNKEKGSGNWHLVLAAKVFQFQSELNRTLIGTFTPLSIYVEVRGSLTDPDVLVYEYNQLLLILSTPT